MAIRNSALRPLHTDPEPARTEVDAHQAAPDERARAEIAAYIFQMAGEMTQMARAAKLDLLAYFLEMARIEAGSLRDPGSMPAAK